MLSHIYTDITGTTLNTRRSSLGIRLHSPTRVEEIAGMSSVCFYSIMPLSSASILQHYVDLYVSS